MDNFEFGEKKEIEAFYGMKLMDSFLANELLAWLFEAEDSKPTRKGKKMSYAWRIGMHPPKNQNYYTCMIIFLIIQVGHNEARVKFKLRLDGPLEDIHDQPCVTNLLQIPSPFVPNAYLGKSSVVFNLFFYYIGEN